MNDPGRGWSGATNTCNSAKKERHLPEPGSSIDGITEKVNGPKNLDENPSLPHLLNVSV